MSRAAVIGDGLRLGGFALAGADVFGAADADAAVAVWEALPEDVTLLLLDEQAAAALRGRLGERPELLRAVVPV